MTNIEQNTFTERIISKRNKQPISPEMQDFLDKIQKNTTDMMNNIKESISNDIDNGDLSFQKPW